MKKRHQMKSSIQDQNNRASYIIMATAMFVFLSCKLSQPDSNTKGYLMKDGQDKYYVYKTKNLPVIHESVTYLPTSYYIFQKCNNVHKLSEINERNCQDPTPHAVAEKQWSKLKKDLESQVENNKMNDRLKELEELRSNANLFRKKAQQIGDQQEVQVQLESIRELDSLITEIQSTINETVSLRDSVKQIEKIVKIRGLPGKNDDDRMKYLLFPKDSIYKILNKLRESERRFVRNLNTSNPQQAQVRCKQTCSYDYEKVVPKQYGPKGQDSRFVTGSGKTMYECEAKLKKACTELCQIYVPYTSFSNCKTVGKAWRTDKLSSFP